jgi:hypothetical protein
MKRIIAALILTAGFASAQLTPDTFTVTWNRQTESGYVNTNVYMSEVTYWLTNCQALIGTATQNLTGCGVYLRVGDETTNRMTQGWIENAVDGRFGCAFVIPSRPASTARGDISTASLQFMLTNGTVVVIDKEQKRLYYRIPLR